MLIVKIFLIQCLDIFWIDEEIKKEVESAMKSGRIFEPKVWCLSSRYIQDRGNLINVFLFLYFLIKSSISIDW